MRPTRRSTTAALAAVLALATPAVPAGAGTCAVTFTTPDSIRAGQFTYEGCDVTVSGTTLVIVGEHAFASLRVTANGLVVAPALDSLRLTVAGDISIDAGSRVTMNGRGYALGAGPGSGVGGVPAPGGSHGGRGGPGTSASAPTYGSLFAPALPGSGGGVSGVSTGRGGGALRFAVGGTLRVDGTLSANGDTAATVTAGYSPGGGAGGSVHLDVGTLAGAGTISANGGRGLNQGGGGGGGRIAIAYGANAFTGAILAVGGASNAAAAAGAAGTIWTHANGAPLGELRVANGGQASRARTDLPDSTTILAGNLRVIEGAVVGVAAQRTLDLTVAGDAEIAAGSAISVDGGGFAINKGPGAGSSGGVSSGGSFGGRGGNGEMASGPTYGSVFLPSGLGSGGGLSGVSNSNGGGALRLAVAGLLLLDGEIRARGDTASTATPAYSPGGGSGGSIRVTAGSFGGTGLVDASGGRGFQLGGGGGGGRIAIEYGASTFAGELRAQGAPAVVAGHGGAAGTVWTHANGAALGELRVANGGMPSRARTDLPDSTTLVAGDVRVLEAATLGVALQATLDLTVAGQLEVGPGAAISVDGGGFPLGLGPGAGTAGAPGSGGSYGGRGGDAEHASGPTYGGFTWPSELGSGGGVSGVSKGAGGGALRLAVAGELRLDGELSARGDTASTITPSYSPGGASGGSIRVTAGSFTGAGRVDAGGGRGCNQGAGGGGGRIAIEYGANTFTGELLACGAPATVAGRGGAAGTIWLRDTDDTLGELRIGNCDRWTLAFTELPDSETVVAGDLDVRDAAQAGVAALRPLHLVVERDVRVEAGAALAVDGRGYAIGDGPGGGAAASPAPGGSHGGRGGQGATASAPTYGSAVFPNAFGSGGGVSGVSKASGGGILQLDVAGTISVDGRLGARGDSATTLTPTYSPGGGAGGSVRVTAGTIRGTGVIDASGGPGWNSGGGGGGGRIAVQSLCWDGFSPAQLRVAGGAGGATPAQPGTITPEFEVGIAAGPIATSGALRVLGYPNWSLAESAVEHADSLALFKERGGLRLAAGDTVWLEVSEPGAVASDTVFSPVALPPGTWLESHLVHLDPPGDGSARARGSVTFDTNVLGVIVTDGGLEVSHAVLRAPGVDYPLGLAGRGLEFAGAGEADTVEISADRRTVTVSAAAGSALDQVRVVTAVPLTNCGPVAGVPADGPRVDAVLFAPPFPNPTRGTAALRFALATPALVRLAIFDIAGRQVATLAEAHFAAGWHQLEWRAVDGAPAGVFFARLEAGAETRTARIVLHR